MIYINDAVQSTVIFSAILIVLLFATFFRKKDEKLFSLTLTQELKGFAILAIIFAHIGYYLVSDNKFLQPLSYLAGVGVDIFLFTSGLGLTMSLLQKKQGVIEFYKKRLLKLYIPFWIVLILLFIGSALILKLGYSFDYILRSFAGLFVHANLYEDINSPLWYFTLILLYYLVFPIVFSKKYPWLSAIVLFTLGYGFVRLNPAFFENVIKLYRVHIVSFPLGMFVAWIFSEPRLLGNLTRSKIKDFFGKIMQKTYLKVILKIAYLCLLAILLFIIGYFAVNSGVGKEWYIEEFINLIIVIAIAFLFVVKPFNSRLLLLFGTLSYEIYLIHWPLAFHYGAFISGIPVWMSMCIYLSIVVGLSFLLKKGVERFNK